MSCAYAMQAIGSYGAGLIDIEELHKIECNALKLPDFLTLRYASRQSNIRHDFDCNVYSLNA